MTRFTLGIDPGIEGAWAIIDDDGAIVSCGDLPTAGDKTQRMVSAPLLAVVAKQWPIREAVVERVGAMPGQGVSSMFRFGRAVGTIDGVLAACGVSIAYVTPGIWKRHYGLGPDKEQSRQRALEMWPMSADLHFSRKKDHGKAEAALIALWGVRAAKLAGAA